MSVDILCIGDLHLGRPIPLPESLSTEQRRCGPFEAWERAVTKAIDLQVDAVVLTGDVIDKDRSFFAALGPLESGIRRMVTAEKPIQVYAVAGNHDVDVLPRIAATIKDFRLLGRNSVWELETIKGTSVSLLGWSFSAAAAASNPLSSIHSLSNSIKSAPGIVIGVLHADITTSSESRYAPVQLNELHDVPVNAWLLGHIHKPSINPADTRPIGYLGSNVGLDPTETGVHGPWLLKVDNDQIHITHLPIAPLQWERQTVPIDSLRDPDDLDRIIADSIRAIDLRNRSSCEASTVGCRLYLSGRNEFHDQIVKRILSSAYTDYVSTIDGKQYFIDKIDLSGLRPSLNLERIADRTDPAAVVAARILELEKRDEKSLQYIANAKQRVISENSQRVWRNTDHKEVSDDDVRTLLIEAGYFVLEELLEQKPDDYRAQLTNLRSPNAVLHFSSAQ